MYSWHETTTPQVARRGRETFAVLAAGAVFAIAALSATGQSLHITLTEPPSVLEAGATWQADLKVQRAGRPVANARPEIVFTDEAGVRHVFPAQPESRAGSYRVKIQLPDGGRWSYEVRLGDDVVRRGEINAKPPLTP
jgi:hypothetical protein